MSIANSSDILQAVIDATPDAIFVKDLDGRYMSFTIYDLLGRSIYVKMMGLSVVSVAAIVLIGCLVRVRRRALA